MACGHCRRPRKKQTYHTAFINVAESSGASRPFPRKTLPHNFPHRCGNPAALLVRSPGKPCHTTFITVAAFRGASRTFWSQYPRAPTTGLLKNPSVLHRDQGTRQGTKQGTKQDSAPSGTQPPHFTLCLGRFGVTQPPAPTTGSRAFLRFTPINQRFCVTGTQLTVLAPSPPPP